MTTFFQLFYVYGAVYFVYTIYSNLFSKQVVLKKSPKDIIKEMTNDPENIPSKMGKEFGEVKPHLKEAPLVIMNFLWMIIGLYTEQWTSFIILLCISPIEAGCTFLIKKVSEKVWAYSFTMLRVLTVLYIYHLKFNF